MKRKAKLILIVLSAIFLIFFFIGLVTYSREQKAAQPIEKEKIEAIIVFDLVNEERHKAGLKKVTLNPRATEAAQQKCDDMVADDYYEHINPKTGKHGYEYAMKLIPEGVLFNENLNRGLFNKNTQVVESWLNSPNHKANMLEPKWTDSGIAICKLTSQVDPEVVIVQEFVQIEQMQLTSYQSDISQPYEPHPSALCADGTYSYSTGSGTCSWHGGVSAWY